MLRKLGYRVEAVANGLEAITSLRTLPYDLVLMDCQMPEMDGYEATRAIRGGASGVLNPQVPIIAMTANAMQNDSKICLKTGMNDYISKPVSLGMLAEILEKWLPKEQHTDTQQMETKIETPLPQTPVYDRAGFLDRMMGDEEIVQTVVEIFLDDIPKQIESLKRSFETSDVQTAKRVAHSIKGAAANIGGEALRELAGKIEKACHEGHFESVNDCCPKLEHQFNRLKEAIQKPQA
jgi:CheY-like chemotaxis protein/HPt (histidine-containing phosphotransfer) domain-containing protein